MDRAEAALTRILNSLGWNEQDWCCAIDLCFFDGISADSFGNYVCNLLEEQWCHSFAVTINQHICWIINCSKYKIAEFNDTFKQLLLDTASSYICRIGVSNFFQGFSFLASYFSQAKTALELGQQKAPHQWCHMFPHYITDYLIKQITQEYTPRQICHKGLLRLLEYDRTHSTNYVKSLKTYLICDKNATRAAEQLFLHRTSLLRQLDRIEHIMGTKINEDYEQELYLRLSLVLMEKTLQ